MGIVAGLVGRKGGIRMTALIWQSAVLLLGAYFIGAFLGCLVRRTFFARSLGEPALAGAGAAPGTAAAAAPPSPATEPVGDKSRRFEEALTGRPAGAPGAAQSGVARDAGPAAGAPSAAGQAPRVQAPAVPTPAKPAPAAVPPTAPPARVAEPAPAQAAAAAAAARAAAAQSSERREAQDKPASTTVLPIAHGVAGPSAATAPIAPAAERPPEMVRQPDAEVTAPARAVEPQDLTRIRAIDAELQKRLYELGVDSYEQIAGWKPADVARIAGALKLPGRIEQENWIEQAQILAKGGETYYSRRRMRGELPSSKPTPNEGERITVRVPAAWSPMPPSGGVAAAAVAATPSAQAPPAAEAKPMASPAAAAVGVGRDQLQRVGGINGEVERLLNAQGVNRFAQIAEWSAAEIARFDSLLGFEGRIARENWIEQARVLANGGETAYSRAMARRLAMPSPPAAAGAARAAVEGGGARSDIGSLRSVRSEAYRADDAAAAGAAAAGRPSDDLKRIRGIGVLIEKRLNALGVSRYEQIANWTAADIERFSEKLDFKGRIERENWVEQARILSAGGQTEFSRRVDRGDL
jgi:predicted flap endonuclease-1-like 5' DNA nuclease